MDFWPVDDRNRPFEGSASKKILKAEQKADVRRYPEVDHGGPNAITLVERDGRLEWASLIKRPDNGVSLQPPGKSTTIFPATRPLLELPAQTSILQSAERGANFLRTYLPDVDIPAELIRDELAQDAKISQKLDEFDPYAGNLLQPVTAYDSTFLAFPMGELNRDLSETELFSIVAKMSDDLAIDLSPFRETSGGIIFEPSARPVRNFATPIQQIATSISNVQTAYLAVRTFGQTSLLEVNTSKITPYLAELAILTHSDTGGRPVVNSIVSAGPLSSIVVNDFGQVYKCTVSGGTKDVVSLRPPPEDEDQTQRDFFWRLARSTRVDEYLLASKDSLSQIDMRSNDCTGLFTSTGTDLITSVEDQQTDHIIKLSSTREILWIDARFPRKPLLGYRHGRQYDRSLEVRTSPLSSGLTLLTSRSNAMVTLYDVTRPEGKPIQVNTLPRFFMSGPETGVPYIGESLFKHPLDNGIDSFSLIRLSKRGSLCHAGINVSDEAADPFRLLWTTEVKDLGSQPLQTSETPYSSQAYTETDLSSTYNQIFCVHKQEREKREEENVEAVYSLLETIPSFWQEVEAPPEHILTTYDAILRAGEMPSETSRADFLTESIINSTRGYRALTQGRLSASALAKGAAWHQKLTPILQRLDPTLPDDVSSGIIALERYYLAENDERSVHSIRYEKEAHEQLALDLALSSDVFSAQPFSRASDEGVALEDLTKTLSLAGEPPAVDFGYLHPIPKSHYITEDANEALPSMAVRSLLKDWQIGADPENHVFTDHYDGSTPTLQPHHKTQPPIESIPQPLQAQRPPTIVAASALPLRPPEVGRRMAVQSQPDFSTVLSSRMPRHGSQTQARGLPQTQLSQEYMMSTQILPGAHGGRPTMPKKKPNKRRVGGF